MVSDESLLTPDLRAQIGLRAEAIAVTIDPVTVARTVETYGGVPRPWRDGDLAPAAVLIALESLAPRPELATTLSQFAQVSHELAVERPLRVGERLVVSGGFGTIIERFGGRFGHQVQVRHETDFMDDSGSVVARTAWLNSRFERHPVREAEDQLQPTPVPGASPVPPRPRTDGHVEAGDALPILHLNSSLADNVRCCAITWNFSPYFFDPAHGANATHHHIALNGPLRLLHLFRAAEEWRGHRGYVRGARVMYRNAIWVGMDVRVHGRVTRLHEQAGTRLADIEQVTFDVDGLECDRGFATVALFE